MPDGELTDVIPPLCKRARLISDTYPEEQAMANIVIKDLSDSIDLDREAMLAISGGSRNGGRPAISAQTLFRHNRIVNYPAGFGSNPMADAYRQAARNKTLK
jgi:hypothetical protein